MSSNKCGTTSPPVASRGSGGQGAETESPALPCVPVNDATATLPTAQHPPGSAWGPDEEAALRRVYPERGAIGTHETLPHRSLDAIRTHAARLGVHDTHRTWSPGEIECLKVVYPKGGPEAVHARLPARSLEAIRHKAAELAIRHDRRSATTIPIADIALALADAGGSAPQAARALGCDYASLRRVATAHGLLGVDRDSKPHWKVTEVEVVRADYPGGGAAAVRAKLPHRSTHAIYRMAKRLGLTGST